MGDAVGCRVSVVGQYQKREDQQADDAKARHRTRASMRIVHGTQNKTLARAALWGIQWEPELEAGVGQGTFEQMPPLAGQARQ